MKPWGQKHSVFFLWSCNHFVEKCPLALTSSVLGRVGEERWCTHSVSPISCLQGWRRNLVAPSYPVQKSSWYFSKIGLQGQKVTEKDKLMSLWQVDICWLVAFLRLSILYLHPYPTTYLPSLSELLNLEQFLHSVYRVGLWSVKIMVIQTKTTVGSVFASDDACVLWPLSCRQWRVWRVTTLVAVLARNWFPANGECSQIVTSTYALSLLQTQKECSALVVQSKKDILFSRTKNNCKKIPTCLLKLQVIVNIDVHKCKNWRTLLAWQTALHKLPSGSITEIAHNCRVRRPSQHSGGEIS